MRFNTHELTVTAFCAAVTAVLAWVIIPLPFSPVPVSGQTIGVMLAGILLPPRLAAASQVIYVLLGLIGLPVFSGGNSGLGTLLGPTGGYIWAFVVGAYCISKGLRKVDKQNKAAYYSVLCLGGVVVIYLFGMIQLMFVADLPFGKAFLAGALPFLPGDLAKVALVGILARRVKHPRRG
ncbi:MAG: biotin transporter BioY [Firmicutes bacterium]|nr:biotin transporter BioY [Bacillota bacterium]